MKRQILSLLLTATVVAAAAHDFTVTTASGKLFFNILDPKAHTAEVTFEGSIAQKNACTLIGAVTIPATVRHQGNVYDIVSIGPKALANAQELTAVTLPASIRKIGAFAFEGCTRLESVIFPGAQVAFGQGTFFRCTSLRDLSLGSDWGQLDFSMFRWSDSLQSIRIPARMQKIQGLKTLRQLRQIEVDANNTHYASANGLLYSKDQKTLLCVPRAIEGAVSVRPGTTSILWEALSDCRSITKFTLPDGLQQLSFRELARLNSLSEIVCEATTPWTTALLDSQEVTLLQVARPDVVLYVPKAAVKAWRTALTLTAGDYTEIAANKPEGIDQQQAVTPYHVEAAQMIAPKNVKAIK